MEMIYSRKEIVEQFMYSEYSDMTSDLMERLVHGILKWNEAKFMDHVNEKGHFTLVRLRKNTYYIR